MTSCCGECQWSPSTPPLPARSPTARLQRHRRTADGKRVADGSFSHRPWKDDRGEIYHRVPFNPSRSPMHDGQPIDAATHITCVRLAWTLVHRIQNLLRPDEVDDCARQFYLDIRAHYEQ